MGLFIGIGNIESVDFNPQSGILTVTYVDGHSNKINLNPLKTDIGQEAQTRSAADADLLARINAEIARATAAENATNANLAAEIIRATNVENELRTAIQAGGGVAAETERATAAETALNNTLQELSALISNAVGQLDGLAGQITAETARATAAENANAAATATEEERATAEEAAIRAELERISHKDDREQRWSYRVISGNYQVTPANEQYLDIYVKISADYSVIYINPENILLGEILVLRVVNPDGYKFRVRSGTYQNWREILGIERNMTKGEVETVFAFKVLTDMRLQLISISDIPDTELEMENIFDATFDNTFD